MSNLKNIRDRLKSVENIKKITDTMGRIAAARLRNAQKKAEQSRPYITKLKEILQKVASTKVAHPLFEAREIKKTGLLIVSADRGFSGSFNSNIFSVADSFLKKYDPSSIELFIIGAKAIDYYKKKKWTLRTQNTGWLEEISYHDLSFYTNQLVEWFLKGEFDEIWILYTHYISVMKREVILEKFLNISKLELVDESQNINSYYFEPSPEEIVNSILPLFCIVRIQTALYESYASELAARILAMQTASKNSDEMIEDLTLIKNKTRQREITREMIEISAGAQL